MVDEQKVLDRLDMEKEQFEQLKLEFKDNDINQDFNEQMNGIKLNNNNHVAEELKIGDFHESPRRGGSNFFDEVNEVDKS